LLYDEYVNVLQGVALRDAGYGDKDLGIGELFLIADELPKVWGSVGGWAWGSLALPSRLEHTAASAAKLLRLGFPEWTVWALPLVQYGLGHVFVSQSRGITLPRELDLAPTPVLADAAAT